MASETFTSVAQTLLTGEMICETVYPNENEWLLPHGLTLKIMSVEEGKQHEYKGKVF